MNIEVNLPDVRQIRRAATCGGAVLCGLIAAKIAGRIVASVKARRQRKKIEKLQKQVDELEAKVEKLEKRPAKA